MPVHRGLNYEQEVYRSCTHLLTQFHVHKKSEYKENNDDIVNHSFNQDEYSPFGPGNGLLNSNTSFM